MKLHLVEPSEAVLEHRREMGRRLTAQFAASRATKDDRMRPAPAAQACPCCGAERWRPDGRAVCVGCELARRAL